MDLRRFDLFKLLFLVIIDFIIIWLWVAYLNPDPSGSIYLLFLVPFVFIVNLLIAGICYLFKKKNYGKLFLINSLLSSIILPFLFQRAINRDLDNAMEEWKFNKSDTTFSIVRQKETNEFDMYFSTSPGSSWGFLTGKYFKDKGVYTLTTDSTKFYIKDSYLIGFRNINDTIKLNKTIWW